MDNAQMLRFVELQNDVIHVLLGVRADTALAELFVEVDGLLRGNLMALLDGLTASVAKNKSVDDSAALLITGLSQRIKDAGTDGAALKALTDELDASSDALAAAVSANTLPA